MLRFIDVRGQGTGASFAFWDTISDKFITVGDSQAWDSVRDLVQDYAVEETTRYPLARMVSLCPEWANHTMLPAADGYTYEDLIAAGWTDEQLIQHAYMQA